MRLRSGPPQPWPERPPPQNTGSGSMISSLAKASHPPARNNCRNKKPGSRRNFRLSTAQEKIQRPKNRSPAGKIPAEPQAKTLDIERSRIEVCSPSVAAPLPDHVAKRKLSLFHIYSTCCLRHHCRNFRQGTFARTKSVIRLQATNRNARKVPSCPASRPSCSFVALAFGPAFPRTNMANLHKQACSGKPPGRRPQLPLLRQARRRKPTDSTAKRNQAEKARDWYG